MTDSQDAPNGTLAHDGYMLHLATLRLIVALDKVFRIRAFTRWLSDRLG
jgi:hypothetical protein